MDSCQGKAAQIANISNYENNFSGKAIQSSKVPATAGLLQG